MSKTKMPDTSLAANREMTQEMRVIHFQKILAALNINGESIYTEIADVAGLEKNQVSRRLLAMIELGLVERLNKKKKTPSGREAFVHKALVGIDLPKIEVEKKTTPSPIFGGKFEQQSLFS